MCVGATVSGPAVEEGLNLRALVRHPGKSRLKSHKTETVCVLCCVHTFAWWFHCGNAGVCKLRNSGSANGTTPHKPAGTGREAVLLLKRMSVREFC